MSKAILDVNNNHAVAVHFNTTINQLTCYLFLKTIPNLALPNPNLSFADSVIVSSRYFERYRGNYRKFCKLRDLIQTRDRRKASMNYLKKLSSLFPDVMDDHLLK